MAFNLASSAAIIAMAGSQAASAAIDSTAPAGNLIHFSNQAEGEICLFTKFNWVEAVSGGFVQSQVSGALQLP